MRPGGLEIRRLAFADRMHMEGVIAGSDAVEREPDQNAARRVGELDLADLLAVLVLQHRRGLVDGERGRGNGERHRKQRGEGEFAVHGSPPE